MQVSGRSFPVTVIILQCFLTFEYESESNANVFHVSGCFSAIDFGLYENADL